jgi:hypothetical protein
VFGNIEIPEGYVKVLLPTSPVTGTVAVPACERCLALVSDPVAHTAWHDEELKKKAKIFKRNNVPPQHWRD